MLRRNSKGSRGFRLCGHLVPVEVVGQQRRPKQGRLLTQRSVLPLILILLPFGRTSPLIVHGPLSEDNVTISMLPPVLNLSIDHHLCAESLKIMSPTGT